MPSCSLFCMMLGFLHDALIAATTRLDRETVPLVPTLGPHSVLESCGLGIPGAWNPLEHRLRDIDRNSSAIGMKLNTKKTNLIMFNPTHNCQAVPFVSLEDGHPLPVVHEMRLLGLLLDFDLTWWPLVSDIVRKCRAKVWSLVKLRDAGAAVDQLVTLYTARVVRSTLEYGCQVY